MAVMTLLSTNISLAIEMLLSMTILLAIKTALSGLYYGCVDI
jgi:hypothetical protein